MAITNGAELTKALKAHGTGQNKIEVCRGALAAVKMNHGRVANCDEVLAALTEAFGPTHATLEKARALIETGQPVAPRPAEVPIEDQLTAAPAEPKPDPAPVQGEETKTDKKKKPAAE